MRYWFWNPVLCMALIALDLSILEIILYVLGISQIPLYGTLSKTGNEGGGLIFIRKQ